MRILDRYILKSLISILIGSTIVFCFIYLLVDIVSNLADFIEQKVSLGIIRDYYSYYLPVIFSQTAPFTCLIAALFALGRLNKDNEIIALRSAGLNFWQLTKSTICLGVIVSAIIFVVNEKIVPQSLVSSFRIKNEKMEIQKKTDIIRNLTFYGLNNRLYFINIFNPKSNSLEGITILEQDRDQNLKAKIVALKGIWEEGKWKFQQCQIFYFDPNGQMNDISEFFEEKIMDISETPQELLQQQIQVSAMNIRQLKEYIAKFSDSGATSILNSLKVDLYQRTAYPFSSLIIMLVGLPFALMTRRRKGMTVTQLGIFVSIAFFYFLTNAIGIAFGKGGIFVPFISAWLANAVFCFLATYLIVKLH